MKKVSFILLIFILLTHTTQAQVPQHLLGLRFGTGDGFGTEISYQYGLSTVNRVELDLGFSSDHVNYIGNRYHSTSWALSGLYHWVHRLDTNLNWYLGPGAKLGSWSYDSGYPNSYSNGIFLAAAGDVGVEYTFPMGIQLALNARPEIGLINHRTDINIGFSVRYQFK
jgi:hypothetical protein